MARRFRTRTPRSQLKRSAALAKWCGQMREWNERLFCLLQLARPENVSCQCVVGSHLTACRLRRIHDIDIVTVIEPLECGALSRYWEAVQEIANELCSDAVHATVEVRSGPLAPEGSPDGRLHVQLHVLTHSIEEWAKVVRFPGGNRWVRSNVHLAGQTLGALIPVPRVTTDAIHRDLCVAVENIESSSAYCRVYDLLGTRPIARLIRVPLTQRQYACVVVQGGIHGYDNVTDPMMGGQALLDASQRIRDQFSSLVDRLRATKRAMDDGLQMDEKEMVAVREDVLTMLRSLRNKTHALRDADSV